MTLLGVTYIGFTIVMMKGMGAGEKQDGGQEEGLGDQAIGGQSRRCSIKL